jgi:hypothetical protein
MRGNGSIFPNEHQHPLKIIQSLNHPLIPKLISYDDESYECEFIEGEHLTGYFQRTRDVQLAMSIIKDINAFFYVMATHKHRLTQTEQDKFRYRGKVILSADDIHEQNIMVTTEGRPYIIDLDQFGWYHPHRVIKLIQYSNIRVCDHIHTSLMVGENSKSNFYEMKYRNELVINKQNIRIKELEAKLLS